MMDVLDGYCELYILRADLPFTNVVSVILFALKLFCVIKNETIRKFYILIERR